MYSVLLLIHSWWRWAVLLSLLLSLYRAYRGWLARRPFTPFDNSLRHNTATVAHVQLILGYGLYYFSPVVHAYFTPPPAGPRPVQPPFFAVWHVLIMTTAIVVLTIGSALAKRRPTAAAKFRTMALWFTAALLLVLLAVPWPFAPWAARPYFRL